MQYSISYQYVYRLSRLIELTENTICTVQMMETSCQKFRTLAFLIAREGKKKVISLNYFKLILKLF